MNQFIFLKQEKYVLIGFMILGFACLALSFFIEPHEIMVMDHGHLDEKHTHHMRFWSNFLHNAVYYLGMSFTAMFAYCAFISAYGGWFSGMKRLWEAYALYMGVGLLTMLVLIVGVWMHWHHLYHWNDESAVTPGDPHFDEILYGKKAFLNKYWYTFATIISVGVWYLLTVKIRSLSIKEDSLEAGDYSAHNSMRYWMAAFLPFGAFTSAVLIWQWMMSIDAHWYSTMYAWNATASFFCGLLSLTILMLIYLKSRGYFPHITENHMHDLGKYLFGFSVFWTYTWFSQYMLIWYSNNGEETIYFVTRRDQYPILFYGNLVLNFALPFLILIRNSSKRKFGTIGFVAFITFFGHWFDIFYMVKPGALINIAGSQEAAFELGAVSGYYLPGLIELGIFLGFTAMYVYFIFNQLTKASLVPKKDPYIGESITHHVI
ncbi:MAG: hypothetical protein AAF573_00070 [Bacteroidota bacterium]